MATETAQEFIVHDFNLPNHENELSKADDIIEKLKSKIRIIRVRGSIDDKSHTELFEEVVRVLDYTGGLSMSVFEIEDDMEEQYKMRFLHAPILGKTLWQEHYGHLHRPYNLIKNRCYKLLDELDEEYKERYKKHPPNWKV